MRARGRAIHRAASVRRRPARVRPRPARARRSSARWRGRPTGRAERGRQRDRAGQPNVPVRVPVADLARPLPLVERPDPRVRDTHRSANVARTSPRGAPQVDRVGDQLAHCGPGPIEAPHRAEDGRVTVPPDRRDDARCRVALHLGERAAVPHACEVPRHSRERTCVHWFAPDLDLDAQSASFSTSGAISARR